MNNNNIEVVIVGSGINALGVLRSLAGRFNVLLVTLKDSYVDKSKFGQRIYVNSTTSDDIIPTLSSLAKQFSVKPALILTEEKTVLHVSEHRSELAGYRFELADHELMLALQSKEGFQSLAEKSNSPVPKSVVIKSHEDLNQLTQLEFPCVFKPMVQSKEYSKRFKKAYKVESAEALTRLYQEIEPVTPEMIAQEWIEGKDSDIYFCLAYFASNGECKVAFTGRKLRSWPLNIGGTAACTSAPEYHQELLSLTASFVKATDYIGLIGMEFKWDTTRKAFYMIEPTVGRTDYQHEIAPLCGTDLLGAMVKHLLGYPNIRPHDAKVTQGAIWYDEFADANALANGADQFSELKLKKFRALLRWSDIGPYIFYLRQSVKKRLGFFHD